MRGNSIPHIFLVLFLSLIASVSFAGGRYADPPPNLVEVQKASQMALDAAKQGNQEATLENTKKARKLAVDSYKEKSTMPMQNSSSRLKTIIADLEGGKPCAESIPLLEEVVKLMNDEVDFYKKEGKL